MCFSPQRRAIFRHRNCKKWSEADVFCTFSLQNVLLATAACNFWFLLWPHDSAPAALTSLLFDSPDTRIIGKTQHFATSLTFGAGESSIFWLSRYCIFFLLTLLHLLTLLSSDFISSICFSSAFQLSILSEVYYLNFLRLCVVRHGSPPKPSQSTGSSSHLVCSPQAPRNVFHRGVGRPARSQRQAERRMVWWCWRNLR